MSMTLSEKIIGYPGTGKDPDELVNLAGLTADSTELNVLDGATAANAGTGKAMITGTSGALTIAGTLTLGATALTATGAELNALAGATSANSGTGKALITGTSGALTIAGALTLGAVVLNATATEINQKCDINNQAVTTTADGTTTGAILATSNFVLITSSSATNQAALPGIAANSLPVGHKIHGFVTANGFELITLATTNETINGVDSDGTNQLDIPANTAFICWVVSATGWAVHLSATATPDND